MKTTRIILKFTNGITIGTNTDKMPMPRKGDIISYEDAPKGIVDTVLIEVGNGKTIIYVHCSML